MHGLPGVLVHGRISLHVKSMKNIFPCPESCNYWLFCFVSFYQNKVVTIKCRELGLYIAISETYILVH